MSGSAHKRSNADFGLATSLFKEETTKVTGSKRFFRREAIIGRHFVALPGDEGNLITGCVP